MRSYKKDIFGAFSTDEILALMKCTKKSVDFSWFEEKKKKKKRVLAFTSLFPLALISLKMHIIEICKIFSCTWERAQLYICTVWENKPAFLIELIQNLGSDGAWQRIPLATKEFQSIFQMGKLSLRSKVLQGETTVLEETESAAFVLLLFPNFFVKYELHRARLFLGMHIQIAVFFTGIEGNSIFFTLPQETCIIARRFFFFF